MDILNLLTDTAWITAISTLVGSLATYFGVKLKSKNEMSISDRAQLSKDQYQLIAELRQMVQEQREEIQKQRDEMQEQREEQREENESLREEIKQLQTVNISLIVENKELQNKIAELNMRLDSKLHS
ncbi:hypothetical protein [Priestia megaterium]|uniref:hypothetical protein n=1 Tax=Priestia megaterium TaxID=1404 RepID=UPI000BFE4B78|nr:hypothetical protein [Priestia megaterium]PGO60733.1 hypothetical protein CN981_09350 [Priestia megaterium]